MATAVLQNKELVALEAKVRDAQNIHDAQRTRQHELEQKIAAIEPQRQKEILALAGGDENASGRLDKIEAEERDLRRKLEGVRQLVDQALANFNTISVPYQTAMREENIRLENEHVNGLQRKRIELKEALERLQTEYSEKAGDLEREIAANFAEHQRIQEQRRDTDMRERMQKARAQQN